MKLRRRRIALAALVLVLFAATLTVIACSPGLAPEPSPHDELLRLHNDARAAKGSPPLIHDERLEHAAQGHAEAMARRGIIWHGAVAARVREQGYPGSRIGENVAMGQADPAAVTRAWLRSPGHRFNVLGKYRHVGFGVAAGRNGRLFWAANFGHDGVEGPLSVHLPDGAPPPMYLDTPPTGLEGFRVQGDQHGRSWWYRDIDGWEYWARPTTQGADARESPLQLQFPSSSSSVKGETINYGLDLPDHDGRASESLTTNSAELGAMAMGVDTEESIAWPWQPKVEVDHGSALVTPIAILVLGLAAVALLFRRRRD